MGYFSDFDLRDKEASEPKKNHHPTPAPCCPLCGWPLKTHNDELCEVYAKLRAQYLRGELEGER